MTNKLLIILSMFLISLACVQALTINEVSSSPEEIAPGEIVTVSIEIENTFEYDLKNINIVLDLDEIPFAPYQSSSGKYLEDLDEGDDETIKFTLVALPETESGIYKIPVKITYEDNEGNPGEKTDLISLNINPQSSLKISVEDSVVLLKGRENEISFRIINSGLGDAKFVFLSVTDSNDLIFLSEKEQYLGDIDSDDFTNADYKLHIEAKAPGTITIPVIFNYKDSTNKEYTETSTINLKIYLLEEAQNLGLVKTQDYTIYIVIGVIIIGIVVYRIIRKRRLKNKRKK